MNGLRDWLLTFALVGELVAMGGLVKVLFGLYAIRRMQEANDEDA